MIEAENRIRFFAWFDPLPKLHRDFMNDYGFTKWFELRDIMNGGSWAFDLKLQSYRKNNPPPTATGAVDD